MDASRRYEGITQSEVRRRRARRNHLRADVAHLPGNQYVGIDFYCPRCDRTRFKPRRNTFEGCTPDVWVDRHDGHQLLAGGDGGRGTVRVHCATRGCERTDYRLTVSAVERALEELAQRHSDRRHTERRPLL